MLENIKSVTLLFLVCSSIFLTWQIWNYQPYYEDILPTEYVDHEGLADRKEITDLVKPEMIIYHHGADTHTISYPEMRPSRFIESKMKDWYFFSFVEIREEYYELNQQSIKTDQVLEIKYIEGIPFQIIADSFLISTEKEMPNINRILIFLDQHTKEIVAMFISEEEQRMIRARTGISEVEFQHYLSLGVPLPEYEAYIFEEAELYEIYPIHYFSKDPIRLNKFSMFYNQISTETMIQLLFVDPTIVRKISEQRGGEMYTDGTRGLQLHYDQQIMYYFQPSTENNLVQNGVNEAFIQRSVQFVNQHQGWDDNYYLYNIDYIDVEGVTQVQYRRHINDYPIYSHYQGREDNVIQLDVQMERVVGYYRPLITSENQIFNLEEIELPSGIEVIDALAREGLSFSEVHKINLGYISDKRDYTIYYTPSWIIHMKNGKKFLLEKIDLEEGAYELE